MSPLEKENDLKYKYDLSLSPHPTDKRTIIIITENYEVDSSCIAK